MTAPKVTSIWTPDNRGGLLVAGVDDFKEMRSSLATRLLSTEPENFGKWQQLDISGSDAHATHELLNVSVWYDMPSHAGYAEMVIGPDMPWAEGHFQERVNGYAVNPGDWHDKWPYHQGKAVELHQHGGKYDHNYMERFWPKEIVYETGDGDFGYATFTGYRFPVGDLDDVIAQLKEDRGTRQAYLPIFFPEDTGATEGQRVPCTLGYHFIIRENTLHMTYNMRSCEIYRHFTNDVYMAVRLAQFVGESIDPELEMGQLTMNITSLHGFVGDVHNIEGFQNEN